MHRSWNSNNDNNRRNMTMQQYVNAKQGSTSHQSKQYIKSKIQHL